MKRALVLIASLWSLVVLSGCSAMHTAAAKKELSVETRLAKPIFLDPVAPERRTVYVEIKNVTGLALDDLKGRVYADLESRGFRVVSNPERATFVMQVVIRHAGAIDLRRRYGDNNGASEGALAAWLISSATGGDHEDRAGAVFLGALFGTLFDASVKDIQYTVITDVRVLQKLPHKISVEVKERLRQGENTRERSRYRVERDRRAFVTRLVTRANKVNLKWEEALPAIEDSLAEALAGIF